MKASEVLSFPADETVGVSDGDFYKVMESVPLPVIIADANNRYLFINQPARDFLECNDKNIIGNDMPGIFHPQRRKSEANIGDTLNVDGETFETEFIRTDGESVWGEVFAGPLLHDRRQIFIFDITERKRAENKFISSENRRWQDQKYDSLGKLTGGVAHELNNLLAIILLQTDILRLQLPPGGSHAHRVNEIKAVVDKAAEIVRQLLAFGSRQAMHPSLIGLNEVVTVFVEKLPALINENINVSVNLSSRLGECLVDFRHVENILADLIRQAVAAMPEGGEIQIETTNVTLDDQSVGHSEQPIGSYVQLSITDNGIGMSPDVKERIFEPRFSTKQRDEGTVPGLATAYGTVKQLKGFIWVESEVNRGTTFTIQFPVAVQPSNEG